MAQTMPRPGDTGQQAHADYRTRKLGEHEWVVDKWFDSTGWTPLPGVHRTRQMAIESTRPPSAFCDEHWSWLCRHGCAD